jgi:nucleotide-binding universal stress UspA family protein
MLRLDTILVPTDFSACSEQALAYALRLARSYGAVIRLLHVAELSSLSLPLMTVEFLTEEKSRTEERMRELLARHGTGGVAIEQVILRGINLGAAGPAIGRYADEHDVDLIALGAHGQRGLKRVLLGSVTAEVTRGTARPVLAVQEPQGAPASAGFERILVPLDLSVRSRRALSHALELAKTYRARLLLLHVADLFHLGEIYGTADPFAPNAVSTADRWVRQEMQRVMEEVEQAGVKATPHVVSGYPPAVILNLIETHAVDLVVMTSHGKTGLDRRPMGSVAEKVFRRATCPLLLLKSFGRSMVAAPVPETFAAER